MNFQALNKQRKFILISAYLFWLDGGQKIDAAVLQENLKIYFDGLIITGGGSVPHNIPPDKLMPTRVRIQKINAEPDDLETYSGAIDMLDYMTMKPITLNYMVHVKKCDVQKHIALFIEASPKLFSDPLWQGLEQMKRISSAANEVSINDSFNTFIIISF